MKDIRVPGIYEVSSVVTAAVFIHHSTEILMASTPETPVQVSSKQPTWNGV